MLGKAGALRQEGRQMARIDALFDELLEPEGSDLHLGIGYPPLDARCAATSC